MTGRTVCWVVDISSPTAVVSVAGQTQPVDGRDHGNGELSGQVCVGRGGVVVN